MPTTFRYFLRCAADSNNISTLTAIWKQCNTLQWYSEKEYYLTHAVYIQGLLRTHNLKEGLCEYQFYNRYHPVNNMINTLVLEGLAEGGYYRDCILLFVSLLLDIRFQLTPQLVTLEMEGRSSHQHIDWLKALSTAHVGLVPVSEPTTFLDSSTRNRLFVLSANSKETSVPLHVKQDDDIGRYIGLNKRAYGQAIACSCVLQNYEFATVLKLLSTHYNIHPDAYESMFSLCSHFVVFNYSNQMYVSDRICWLLAFSMIINLSMVRCIPSRKTHPLSVSI